MESRTEFINLLNGNGVSDFSLVLGYRSLAYCNPAFDSDGYQRFAKYFSCLIL